jgi:hypothetical protein
MTPHVMRHACGCVFVLERNAVGARRWRRVKCCGRGADRPAVVCRARPLRPVPRA